MLHVGSVKCLFDNVTNDTLSAHIGQEPGLIMNYLLFSFKTLYFHYISMVFLSRHDILYIIGKLEFPSFKCDYQYIGIHTDNYYTIYLSYFQSKY